MKLPKCFRPKKDLEKKTEELVHDARILKNEPKVGYDEVEEIVSMINPYGYYDLSDEIHLKLETLLRKSDYLLLPKKDKNYEHWVKQDPIEQYSKRVFTARHSTNDKKTYYFARVEESKLENYCKRFERCHKLESMLYNNDQKVLDIGAYLFLGSLGLGLVTGGVGLTYLTGIKLISFWTPVVFSLGAISGVVGAGALFLGALLSTIYLGEKVYNKYEKGTKKFYEEFITDDVDAIKSAFN
ncbi:MAG: hypothetical protein KKA79_08715 [Nanoarchaeota archaeon]|nr:hypothetical protein [Nanoarchaeota archaeon]MCG2717310.1 hypothetical protein [Nanoarchaeota archaeon]